MKERAKVRSGGADKVRLSVAGRVVDVEWDKLLDPESWFRPADNEAKDKPARSP